MFHFLPAWRGLLEFATVAATCGGAIYAAIYAAYTLRVQAQALQVQAQAMNDQTAAMRSQDEWSRRQAELAMKKAAFKRLAAISDSEHGPRAQAILELQDWKKSPEDLLIHIKNDPALKEHVPCVLGDIEDTAIAIRHGVIDEDIMYQSISYIVDTIEKKLKAYIEERQRRDDELY
ncbi:MAG: hypothetical protein KC933_15730 [Myxococcales bacterium]|nr:hypothetical protein [Myxococcales bacterium]